MDEVASWFTDKSSSRAAARALFNFVYLTFVFLVFCSAGGSLPCVQAFDKVAARMVIAYVVCVAISAEPKKHII